MKKLRDLGNRENRNILELKINKMIIKSVKVLEKDKQLFILKALNFFSPRPSSFTVLVEGKGFINPFFRLLDSSNKNAEMS